MLGRGLEGVTPEEQKTSLEKWRASLLGALFSFCRITSAAKIITNILIYIYIYIYMPYIYIYMALDRFAAYILTKNFIFCPVL